MDKQTLVAAIDNAFGNEMCSIFSDLCSQISMAGPGNSFARVKNAMRAREVLLQFTNETLFPKETVP